MAVLDDLGGLETAIDDLAAAVTTYLASRDLAIGGADVRAMGFGTEDSVKTVSNDRLLELIERRVLYFHQKHSNTRTNGTNFTADAAAVVTAEESMLALTVA